MTRLMGCSAVGVGVGFVEGEESAARRMVDGSSVGVACTELSRVEDAVK